MKPTTISLQLVGCTLLLAATGMGYPARAADAYHGQQLAHRWCAPCNAVAFNQPEPTSEAPPFVTIAHRQDFDAERLTMFLLDPHPKMPDMSLTRFEAGDLAAYIATLAR